MYDQVEQDFGYISSLCACSKIEWLYYKTTRMIRSIDTSCHGVIQMIAILHVIIVSRSRAGAADPPAT